ncbi:hypothetical protein HUG15_19960 [Salicibibacter cibarius]|uniref:Uncharacterized protein n=1 Tax=Salicibibacter cibarius TaxID=2743000 RepID=A0A7T6Z695_9BACI|nr:hypothetical protein HUG15_19960 [Salicibibacter cibarius]
MANQRACDGVYVYTPDTDIDQTIKETREAVRQYRKHRDNNSDDHKNK